MSMGWICLHREMQNNWIYQDAEALKFWIYLLFNANHKDHKSLLNGKLITVDRGSLIGGRMALSEATGVSERKVRRLLSVLQSDGMLSIKTTTKYSIISITNYNEYQSIVQQTSNKRPQSDPQSDPHNNNGNNDNNGNKKEGRFAPPSPNEVHQYMTEKGLDDMNEAEKFVDHYESNGWKVGGKAPMKSWQAAVRNWLKRNTEDSKKPQSFTKMTDKELVAEAGKHNLRTQGKSRYDLIDALVDKKRIA